MLYLSETDPSEDFAKKAKILIVDDEASSRYLLRECVHAMGFECMEATNGREALEAMYANPSGIDILLLDRMMPEIDGMEVVHQMQKDPILKTIPVVMQTSADKPEEIREGIELGVFYYLTKPIDIPLMKSVLKAATRVSKQNIAFSNKLQRHSSGFQLMQTGKFEFRTMKEAENLACFLANCFPEPARVVNGLAELMFNAVEHGNLSIGFEKKAELCKEGKWKTEIEHRLENPNLCGRVAEAVLTHKDGGIYVVVTDQGDGFQWQNFMKINPTRAGDAHGRGIAMANSISFDKLTFNEKGNTAIAYVAETSRFEW